jgi:hypothetical protein
MQFHDSCRIQWRISQETLPWVGIGLRARAAAAFSAFVPPSSAETDSLESHLSITVMLTEVKSHAPNEWVRCGGIIVRSHNVRPHDRLFPQYFGSYDSPALGTWTKAVIPA